VIRKLVTEDKNSILGLIDSHVAPKTVIINGVTCTKVAGESIAFFYETYKESLTKRIDAGSFSGYGYFDDNSNLVCFIETVVWPSNTIVSILDIFIQQSEIDLPISEYPEYVIELINFITQDLNSQGYTNLYTYRRLSNTWNFIFDDPRCIVSTYQKKEDIIKVSQGIRRNFPKNQSTIVIDNLLIPEVVSINVEAFTLNKYEAILVNDDLSVISYNHIPS
jgi:hypothetical protein